MNKIKILVADDHLYLADGIEGALEDYPDIEVVGKIRTLSDLEDGLSKLKPDVLLLDIMFGERITGIQFADKYIEQNPNMKVIIFSQYDDEATVGAAYDVGASAFLRKNIDTEELYKAIKVVYGGEKYIGEDIAKILATSYINRRSTKSDSETTFNSLTEREVKIFTLAAKGLTHPEIASALGISTRTVAKEFGVLKSKLSLERQTDFTVLAIKLGVMDL